MSDCNNCENRLIPAQLITKHNYSQEEYDWLCMVRENYCADCLKNLPFVPDDVNVGWPNTEVDA